MLYRRVDRHLVVGLTGEHVVRAKLGRAVVYKGPLHGIDFDALRQRIGAQTRAESLRRAPSGGTQHLRRLLISVDAAGLVTLPWERAAPRGFTPIRVSAVSARILSQRLTLPVRIVLSGVAADVARSLEQLDDNRLATVTRVKAARLQEWRRAARPPLAHVLHLAHAVPARSLTLARPEVVGTLGWLVRVTSQLQARLLVLQVADEDELPRALELAHAIADRAGPAVLVTPADADVEFLYRAILDDEPLDAVAGALNAAIVAGAGREDALRISAVVEQLSATADALAAAQDASFFDPDLPTLGTATIGGTAALFASLRRDGIDDPAAVLRNAMTTNFDWSTRGRADRYFLLKHLPSVRPTLRPPPKAPEVARAISDVRKQAQVESTAVARPREIGPRFVNLALEGQGRRMDQRQRLRAGRLYELAFAIGPRDAETVSFGQRALVEDALFHDPKIDGRWVEVGVVGLDFDVKGASLQQLWLPRIGPTQTARFTVVARTAGAVRLRVCLYVDNSVVQSHMFAGTATGAGAATAGAASGALAEALGVSPSATRDLSWSWRLEYDAAQEAADILKRRPRTLGIVANDLDGESVVTVKGTDVIATTRDDGNLMARVEAIRLALQDISNPDPHDPSVLPDRWPYQFPNANRGEEADLHAALHKLAEVGYALFRTAFGAATQDALREELEQGPGRIDVAHLVLKKIVPWAAVYDRFYDAGAVDPDDALAPRIVTKACTAPLHPGAPPGMRCRDSPACILHKDAAPPGEGQIVSEETVACPLHFWGFRHEIEVPPRQAPKGTATPAASETVRNHLPTRVAVAMHGGLAMGAAHLSDLHQVLENARSELVGPAYLRRDVLAQLKDKDVDVLYLFCHADGGTGTSIPNPRLRFAGVGGKPESSLTSEQLPPDAWEHSPLVVLNGCRTGAFRADALSPFVTFLIDKLAAGVLATEIEVDERLAAEIGASVLSAFVRGERIAAALLTSRRELLAKYNPLGLSYTLFADGDLRLAVKP